MKKTLSYILSAVASLSVIASCSLDQFPTNAIRYENGSRVIETEEDLYSWEAGIMYFYRAVHGGMYNAIEEVMLDGFNATADFGNNYGSVHRTDGSFTSSDSYIDEYWQDHYVVIKNYNVLIDALNDPQNIPAGTEEDAAVIQGEAYFCRAEAYLNLIRHFAKDYDPAKDDELGVPIVLHYDLYERPSRSSVHTVYKQIKEDLDSAAKRLAAVEATAAGEPYPTIDAVNALYARYFIDVEDFENAAVYAQKVISNTKYILANDADKFSAEYSDDAGTEAILQLFGSTSELPNTTTLYTNMQETTDHGTVFSSQFLPSKKLALAYEEGDLRKAWFSTTDYYTRINDSYFRGAFSTFVKYIGNSALNTGNIPNGANLLKPYKISEMYLIRAEAFARDGRTSSAKTTLNSLQRSRKATETSGSLENVQAEWFRETPGEGFRLSCLKRWHLGIEGREGQTGAVSNNALMTGTYYEQRTIAPDADVLTWPIPASQIRINANLKQNPGYGISD